MDRWTELLQGDAKCCRVFLSLKRGEPFDRAGRARQRKSRDTNFHLGAARARSANAAMSVHRFTTSLAETDDFPPL